MSIKFNRSQTFATNGTVTAAGLHNLVDGLDIYQALITEQTSLAAVAPEDSILIADASLTAGDAPRQTTVSNLFDDALTGGTYTNINLTGSLSCGTLTNNRTTSTTAIIPNLTAGTTTSTAATITTGTIPTLTIGSTTATAGTITTFNSTTGTITNLSTTLAGDLTISQGTATLGTSGVTAGTYGTSTIIPTIAVDAKGRVTSVGTSSVSAGKVLQVVSTTNSTAGGNGGFTTNSTNYVDISGLSANITPSSSLNKILIQLTISCCGSNYSGAKIVRVVSGVETDIGVTQSYGANRQSAGFPISSVYSKTSSQIILDSPGTTNQITYKVKIKTNQTYPDTFILNEGTGDGDVTYNFMGSSNITAIEISA